MTTNANTSIEVERDFDTETMNPTHSCPVDILQLVFELAVPVNADAQYNAAIALSHVCQRWRNVAISTPRLWNMLYLDLDRPRSSLDDYSDEMIKRVRGVPLDVTIRPGHTSFNLSLPTKFREWATIDALNFAFRMGDDAHMEKRFNELISLDFPIALNPIRHLRIPYFRFTKVHRWVVDSWLLKWPAITKLDIFCIQTKISWAKETSVTSIKHFSLYSRGSTLFSDIANAFPNLETLSLPRAASPSKHPNVTRIELPSLETLHMDGDVDELWSCPSCPNLICLFISAESSALPPQLCGFLESHPSIQNLFLGNQDVTILLQLSKLMPQLTRLKVKDFRGLEVLIDWKAAGLDSASFPNLQRLDIEDEEGNISVKEFDMLVAARCLPVQELDSLEESQSHQPLQMLTFKTAESHCPPEWLSSSLLEQAHAQRASRSYGSVDYAIEWKF